MVNVNEYQILLKVEDWNRLDDELGDNIEKLFFEKTPNKYNLLEINDGKYSVDHWKNEFNYKLVSIGINYGYLYTYYKSLDGFDIYQVSDSEKLAYHFWFSYEAESLLTRLVTLIDNLYHLINIKFDLNVEEGLGFRKKITKKLTEINSSLALYLEGIYQDSRYKSVQDIRNDFTHNHSPLNLTSGYKKEGNEAFFSKGDYLKPSEIVDSINEFINLLQELKTECSKYL
ncbi:Cthe_2314 family HEPN domain-containing protein [Lysinibacillus sphaericus]|uniref:Cthe_2314 family HEPN domain-containing protein n=1 Tax=Lysinibacillus sphaericus TaxID=1421 RepID=UPI003D72ACEF